MNSFAGSIICPRCDAPKMRSWDELSDEEKYLVERLPLFADIPLNEQKKHRFCTRCWFEETNDRPSTA
ncbi:MAG: hypothetical protein ABI999_08425 [Acidobacteriota bacterium]